MVRFVSKTESKITQNATVPHANPDYEMMRRNFEVVEDKGKFPIVSPISMERDLIILNKLGLHARPAAEFVRCARKFKCRIMIRKDGEDYSAESILDVLSANLDCGSHMLLSADGPDAQEALDQLAGLLAQFRTQEDG
jgi:phosphocarrier protein